MVSFPNGDKLSKKEEFFVSGSVELEEKREMIRCRYEAEGVSFTYEEIPEYREDKE
jgi:hypothetical protein